MLLLFLVSCGLSEECFKATGELTTTSFEVLPFDKIYVYQGVKLIVKQADQYQVTVETGKNLANNVEVRWDDGVLRLYDHTSCNWVRGFGQTTIYVSAPHLTEIHSNTAQDIISDGVLTYPILRLFSIDLFDGVGTGDFYISVDNNQTVIENNNLATFYIQGNTTELLLNFYFGNAKFFGQNLEAQHIKVFHRGSNSMYVRPFESIEGELLSTGNLYLKSIPEIIQIETLYTGQVIYDLD